MRYPFPAGWGSLGDYYAMTLTDTFMKQSVRGLIFPSP